MKLYDSYSKEIKEIKDKKINIYNCGPTVYNHIHIGNARPLIIFDVLYRYLKFINKDVEYVHNITDIDDKIINQALKDSISELELSNFFSIEYTKIREELNTLEMITPKVSENIPEIINYIERLVDIGAGYEINGNVYFDTTKVKEYGKLSNRKLEEQELGERVAVNNDKKNLFDFIIWKKTEIGIQWKTKWCLGRPGWHTECSLLIEKYFGNNLTIHGGGIDLKFPHHENENAQNEALHNSNLAKVWMHVGHVNINDEKMSKSLNNFVLMKDILKKYSYQTIRWFFYSTNYKNPLNYNDDIIQSCNIEINKIKNSINVNKTILIGKNNYSKSIEKNDDFLSMLNNDLNISNGVTIIRTLLKTLNIDIRDSNYTNCNHILNQIICCLNILGIEFDNIHTNQNIQIIKEYNNALDKKDFIESDNIRIILKEKGLI